MKRIIILLLLYIPLLKACSQEEKPEIEKKVSKRDYSITAANAYSTLFLDSMRMENYISSNPLNDSVIRRMRSFYNTRNYQFAWFSEDGLTEQARGFWNLHEYVTTYDIDSSLRDEKLQKRMDALIAEHSMRISEKNEDFIKTELKLTEHLIRYVLNNFEKGFVKRKEMERFIPRKKEDALYLADSLVNKKHKDDRYFSDVNEPYAKLKEQLAFYLSIAKKGGWPALPESTASLKPGDNSQAVALLRQRLRITGDYPGADTSTMYNDSLATAVNYFGARHGYSPEGKMSKALLAELNVPVKKRIQQLLMNMERMRWMPTTQHDSGNLVMVNIPEFVLHMYEDGKKAFDMPVVVGKEGNNTMMFTGDLKHVVFSPYWNVPSSIVREEILPAMQSNPNYLASQNMEQTGTNGNGTPVIRQLPGAGNALGKVKFLFPNRFNIYFHDTPAKSLFSRDKRAFSHGCIRLADPEKMARYLLRNQSEWTNERIRQAMNSGTEKWVNLENEVPVVITYYTAWVDEEGRLNFREDIYDHDKKLARKMFVGAA